MNKSVCDFLPPPPIVAQRDKKKSTFLCTCDKGSSVKVSHDVAVGTFIYMCHNWEHVTVRVSWRTGNAKRLDSK